MERDQTEAMLTSYAKRVMAGEKIPARHFLVECAGTIDIFASTSEEAEAIALKLFKLEDIVAAHAEEIEE